jgi:hypothetical protein
MTQFMDGLPSSFSNWAITKGSAGNGLTAVNGFTQGIVTDCPNPVGMPTAGHSFAVLARSVVVSAAQYTNSVTLLQSQYSLYKQFKNDVQHDYITFDLAYRINSFTGTFVLALFAGLFDANNHGGAYFYMPLSSTLGLHTQHVALSCYDSTGTYSVANDTPMKFYVKIGWNPPSPSNYSLNADWFTVGNFIWHPAMPEPTYDASGVV